MSRASKILTSKILTRVGENVRSSSRTLSVIPGGYNQLGPGGLFGFPPGVANMQRFSLPNDKNFLPLQVMAALSLPDGSYNIQNKLSPVTASTFAKDPPLSSLAVGSNPLQKLAATTIPQVYEEVDLANMAPGVTD